MGIETVERIMLLEESSCCSLVKNPVTHTVQREANSARFALLCSPAWVINCISTNRQVPLTLLSRVMLVKYDMRAHSLHISHKVMAEPGEGGQHPEASVFLCFGCLGGICDGEQHEYRKHRLRNHRQELLRPM